MRRLPASLLMVAFFLSARVQAGEMPDKRLIEFGWDEPDTAFLRAHIAEMQKTPFDGCVFHVSTKGSSLTWDGWGRKRVQEPDLQPALDDLKATAFGRFNQNFLRFNTTPADLDWFDDYSAVVHNARLAARLARDGSCRGLLFDIEQYSGKLFSYHAQRDAKTKSWNDYAGQARKRGREVMAAFQEGYSDVTLFLTFGYSLPWNQSDGGKTPLSECSYGLLAPFLDGMVDAARGKTRIVDGHELSYGFKDPDQFPKAAKTMHAALKPIVADPDTYDRVISAGFGIWLDYDWRKHGWDPADPSKNYFTPGTFQASVKSALDSADEFVWIYTETPRWWSPEGKRMKLPEPYAAALEKVREELGRN